MQIQLTEKERAQVAGNWRVSMAPLYERRTGPRKVALEPTLAPAAAPTAQAGIPGKLLSIILQQFKLPVRNVVAGLRPEEFFLHGTIVEVAADRDSQVMAGLPEKAAVFADSSPVFETLDDLDFGSSTPDNPQQTKP